MFGIMQNASRRLAQGGRSHMRPQPRTLRSFRIHAAAPLGETLHKNFQAPCNTFLYCVLRKFWGGASCLCLVLLVYFLESIYVLCMLCASALEAAKPAALLSGVVKTRGAMVCSPRVDPANLLHRHAWVGHAAASAAASLQPRRDTPLAD
jgi:hypothetical protein